MDFVPSRLWRLCRCCSYAKAEICMGLVELCGLLSFRYGFECRLRFLLVEPIAELGSFDSSTLCDPQSTRRAAEARIHYSSRAVAPSSVQVMLQIKSISCQWHLFSMDSMEAQEKLPTIQGVRGIYYTGAWCSYGFHEDGIRASVGIVQQLGCALPWVPRSLNPKTRWMDTLWLKTFHTFAQRGFQRGLLRVILPNGSELQYGDGCSDPVLSEEWRHSPKCCATIRVFNMSLFKKIAFKADTGLAEGYMDDDFAVDDIGSLMAIAAVNAARLTKNQKLLGIWGCYGNVLLFLTKSLRVNTIEGSRRHIKEHYDIGNAYYK